MIKTDRRLRWILLGGLAVQFITAITAIGASSADQHFQIIEFSLNQLGQPSGAPYVWEYENFVRPTLQVYLFSGYHLLLNAVGFTDPYAQLTLLRILLGLSMFALFNAMALHYFKNEPRRILIYVLLLMNFSWALPYTRTLFCSEMMSSLFFFGTFFLYDINKERQRSFLFLLLIGLLFSLTFYFRFQIASAMAAFGIWLLYQKKFSHILPIFLGFAVGVLGNVCLDYGYYKEWVFTPYAYFYVNINAGRAASFGTSSFTRYIALIIGVMPAPLFGLIFFYYTLKTFFKRIFHPVFLATVLFVVAHSFVGHKEERFMFPIFNVLPLLIGWSIPELEKYYAGARRWIRGLLKGLLVFTIALNTILLLALCFLPYSQTVQFSYLLRNRFEGKEVTLHCLGQTPFETPNGSPMVFYKNGAKNIHLHQYKKFGPVRKISGPAYLATTFNEIKGKRKFLEALGYRPVMYSSDLLWNLNEWLESKGINTINEIWVLYVRE